MTVDSLEDMFVYQLEEMYGIENELVDVLGELATETEADEMSQGFEEHREETREQVRRLEQVFAAVDRDPSQRASATMEGLITDHEQFSEEVTDQEMMDIFNLGAGLKTERMEITGYESLLMLARNMDLGSDVIDPLQENLDEEESTRTELKTMAGGSKVEAMLKNLVS